MTRNKHQIFINYPKATEYYIINQGFKSPKMKTTLPLLLLLFVFSQCKRGDLPLIPAFSGVTVTDNLGVKLSDDPTDWTFTDRWSSKEAGLFQSSYPLSCTASTTLSIIAYPNPSNGIFILEIAKPGTARLEIRLVDKNFNTLITNDAITSTAVQLNASTFGIKGLVRLYYRLIDNGCEYRGHGDIKIQ